MGWQWLHILLWLRHLYTYNDYCNERPGGSEKNRTQYVHTSSGLGGTSFYVSSGYYPQTTTAEIGATADESGGGCSWSSYHSHIESLSGWDSKRSYPDHTTCNLPNIPDDCGYFDNYTYPMYRDAWTY